MPSVRVRSSHPICRHVLTHGEHLLRRARAVWALRQKIGLRVAAVVRSSMAWSIMSDLNSRCYRPHQDVV